MAPRRVLVVDDDVENVDSLCELLRLWGYDAEGARDGERALALVESWHPVMAIMDLGLAEGGALDVIKRIKVEDDGIVIIAFSGWKHLETAALAAGAGAFVLKPDLESLEMLLANRPAPVAGRRRIARKRTR